MMTAFAVSGPAETRAVEATKSVEAECRFDTPTEAMGSGRGGAARLLIAWSFATQKYAICQIDTPRGHELASNFTLRSRLYPLSFILLPSSNFILYPLSFILTDRRELPGYRQKMEAPDL
jgi:hypothetical protein